MNIDRVKKMEAILDECRDATESLDAQLNRMDALRPGMMNSSGTTAARNDIRIGRGVAGWRKAGVLSEDLAYDEMTAIRDTAGENKIVSEWRRN